MPRKPAQPRIFPSMHGSGEPSRMGETWIEPEHYCYPSGRRLRRALVRHPDGKLRIVLCGVADTYFTISCRGGFITTDDTTNEFVFRPTTQEAQ